LVIMYVVMTFITVLYYDNDAKGLGLTLLLYTTVCMIYYYAVANKRQFFSKEEQDKFMKAYVVNANKQRRMGGGSGRSSSKGSSKKTKPIMLQLADRIFGSGSMMGSTSAKSASQSNAMAISSKVSDVESIMVQSSVRTAPSAFMVSSRVGPDLTGSPIIMTPAADGALVPLKEMGAGTSGLPPMFLLGDSLELCGEVADCNTVEGRMAESTR